MFISNNCLSFHLWWMENLLKHQKVSKYYETDCGPLLDIFADFKRAENSFWRNSANYGTPCHAIGYFVFYYHHFTYRTPCHAIGHLMIYRECYEFERALLLSDVFYLTLLRAGFKAPQGAGSSPFRLAWLHADLRNIAPVQLFVWITTIHKKGYSGRST